MMRSTVSLTRHLAAPARSVAWHARVLVPFAFGFSLLATTLVSRDAAAQSTEPSDSADATKAAQPADTTQPDDVALPSESALPPPVDPAETAEAAKAAAVAEANDAVKAAQAAADAQVERLKSEVEQLRAQAQQFRDQAEARLEKEKDEAIENVLERTRVETDQFTFGVFPNSAGFMDARLHVRASYLQTLSSGLYLDYTTARAVFENELESRSDRLVREYRGEVDLLKGILLLAEGPAVAWSVEPGANGKVIHQDIDDSGFNTNSFDETVFQSSDLRVTQLVSSIKLDTTLVIQKDFLFDFSGEYLPFIYQLESGTTVTSQFDEPVDFALENHTSGYQLQARLLWDAERYGKFAARALAYRAEGSIAARSSLVSGNFEYTFETFNNARRVDTWAEVMHTATYVKLFGNLAPAIALAFQRKQIETSEDSLSADTYKVGFLLEWQ